jgi:hypothetical protein
MKKPLPSGSGSIDDQELNLLLAIPFAGIIQIRFNGYDLRQIKPPRWKLLLKGFHVT